MIIYFARHGKTIYGQEKRFEGVSDSPLTEEGRNQARRLANFLKDKNIHQIFTSPLGRARTTTEIVGKVLNLEPTIDDVWREISYGDWDGKKKEELCHCDQWQEREKNKYTFIHPGSCNNINGESYELLYKRISPKLIELKNNLQGNNSLIVAHIGILRTVKKFFKETSDEETVAFTPTNSTLIKVAMNSDNTIFFQVIEY